MKNFLESAAKMYYDGHPIISDDEWDYLAELHKYQQVGASPTGKKINHRYRLYSLQKFYETDTVPFNGGVKTPKLDGSAVAINYVDGKYVSAATRGDGIIGEDISANIKYIVPDCLEDHRSVTQVIGELIAPKTIPNARNYASGAARLKSEEEFLTREVTFIAYGVEPFINSTYEEDMQYLKQMGFHTVLDEGLTDVYPTDGVVHRINNNLEYAKKGFTDKHPRGAFALKNTSDVEKVHTTLREVIWQVGKSGKVTPVAIFDEIDIEGAKINKATLHNAGFIEDLDLYLEDEIIVTRAGGIIPKVLGKV